MTFLAEHISLVTTIKFDLTLILSKHMLTKEEVVQNHGCDLRAASFFVSISSFI